MQAKNDISDELRSLSALVEGIGRQVPYGLPEGYFEGLPLMILNRIEEAKLASNLSKSLTFSVPEGYFDDFASRVLGRINLMSSPASSPALSMGEGVGEELARISSVVSRIGRVNPYQLPEGYFEEVSPILSVLKDKATYIAPGGYFDYLPAAATEKAVNKVFVEISHEISGDNAGAKIVPIGSRGKLVKGHWWKIAGAAAAACVILVFSWPQLHTGMTKTNEGQQTAQVELAQGLSSRLSQGLHKVSDQDIENYLEDANSIQTEAVTNSTATLDMDDSDVKSLLGNVPDNELQQYMEEHGRANDIATN
jgi:hypothetical protein